MGVYANTHCSINRPTCVHAILYRRVLEWSTSSHFLIKKKKKIWVTTCIFIGFTWRVNINSSFTFILCIFVSAWQFVLFSMMISRGDSLKNMVSAMLATEWLQNSNLWNHYSGKFWKEASPCQPAAMGCLASCISPIFATLVLSRADCNSNLTEMENIFPFSASPNGKSIHLQHKFM